MNAIFRRGRVQEKKVHVTRDDGSQRFLVTRNYELPQTALQGLAVGLKLFIKVIAKMSQKCLHRLTLGNGASKTRIRRRIRNAAEAREAVSAEATRPFEAFFTRFFTRFRAGFKNIFLTDLSWVESVARPKN